MIRKLMLLLVALAILGGAAFWLLTTPRTLAASDIPDHTPDLVNGERLFWAGGCESCHAAAGATGDARFRLGGGLALDTPYGVFNPPNISPDVENGIGSWSLLDFVNSMKRGIGPGGQHLYPAFPYASYQRMTLPDIIDLKAYLDTLPAVDDVSRPNELAFPYAIRRGLGLWQLIHIDGETFEPDPEASDIVNRGAYLVEGPGHCGECHTPRGFDGATIASLALSGGPPPEGTGRNIPNITPHETGLGAWSESDIVNFLQTGFTPDFDSAGGTMAAVILNTQELPVEDLQAIAAYLKSVPPIASAAAGGS